MGNVFTINVSCDTIFSNCIDCTVGKATYISELEDNLVALQTAMEKLVEAGNDVMTRVVIAEQKNMERLNQVQGWLSRVHAMEVEVGKLLRDASQEIEKLCLGGFCSKNCKSSYRLGKKVNKMLQAVATLTSEGDFKAVAERIPEAAVDERPIDPTIVGLQANVDEVWRLLGEERVGILGLYGMGGVGKTTLLTQINNRFLNTPNDFDLVIWVLVSKDLQLEKIQDTIGNKLGFCDESWKRKSITEKSVDIFRVLSKKNFVLLLDDIWERVDLTKVGVPLPSPKIASKVVFTTRFINVCGLMEAHETYKVQCLNHDEAWKLFKTKVGEDILDGHPDIPELAETVARECCGLPLALITIGRAMAYKKTPEEWSYAIQVLRRAAFNFPGMEKEVYPLLKFSYDSLPSNKIRACLLYCSLYPEDYTIPKSELIDCWIGEGYLDGTDKLYEGYYILGILLHACLLEEEEENYVKMHDVIRDMTLWIACEIEKERENFLVQAGTGLTEAPEIGKWECVKKISLMENEIENLPRSPVCPILQTLFLSRNDLKVISNDFFQFMPSLRLLNLSHNRFLTILPLGISKLVSLQHLDLSGTSIRELPKDLVALVNLKCLNLEDTAHLNAIPRHLISHFSMLHVLRMLACGFAHTGEDSVLSGGSKFLVEELFGLKHLNVLSITLTSSHALQMLLTSHMLQSCTQALCLRFVDSSKSLKIVTLANLKRLNKVQIRNCNNLEELKIDCDGEIQEILMNHGFRSLHTILIDSCLRLRDVTWLILAPNVKIIRISSCPTIVEVINVNALDEVSMKIEELNLLSKLEFLELANLGRLGSICKTALPFSHLKEIRVTACPELKMLPLDCNTKPNIIIRGEGFWWRRLIWEDLVIENAFLPCFIPYS